jgi:hypothetical protein
MFQKFSFPFATFKVNKRRKGILFSHSLSNFTSSNVNIISVKIFPQAWWAALEIFLALATIQAVSHVCNQRGNNIYFSNGGLLDF